MCNTKISGYPSIDKPWLKYYSSEVLHAQPALCTVYQNIYQHNKEHLSETALEYFGVKITFSKLFEHVEACAKALLSNGVRAGDCVTLCTAGTPEAVYIVLACSKIGALANFVNPMFQPAQIRDRINETNAAFLFVLDKLYASVSSILSETCIRHLVVLPATASLPAPLRILAELKSPLEPELKQALHENILLKKDFFGDKLQLLKELHTHCEQVLPAPAVPSAYKFRDSFSVKPSGKRDTEALTHEYNDYLVFENAAIYSVDFYRNFQK